MWMQTCAESGLLAPAEILRTMPKNKVGNLQHEHAVFLGRYVQRTKGQCLDQAIRRSA
jgi:hypothetical protein